MRGKPCGPHACRHRTRIIPAHAGQTVLDTRLCMCHTDHPRACGANYDFDTPKYWYYGSSPRMRGKQRVSATGTQPARIIPAHAGQTIRRCGCVRPPSDHPRACGANSSTNCSNSPRVGSSPRMRGKPLLVLGELACARIIPAHAGQTLRWGRRWIRCTDHPRACGANLISYRKQHRPCGSSPRMRGKPHH